MAQHRDRQRRVHRLMRSGQLGRRGLDRAPGVAIAKPAPASASQPPPRGSQSAPAAAAAAPTRAAIAGGIELGQQRHAGFGDAGFLGGDIFESVAEKGVMVVAQLGDAAGERARG